MSFGYYNNGHVVLWRVLRLLVDVLENRPRDYMRMRREYAEGFSMTPQQLGQRVGQVYVYGETRKQGNSETEKQGNTNLP